MIFIWLMGLITLGLLVWFGMQVFSGGIGSAFEAASEKSSDSGNGGSGSLGSDGAHSEGTSGAGTDSNAASNTNSTSAAAGSAGAGTSAGAGANTSATDSSASAVSGAAGAAAVAAVAAGGVAASSRTPSYKAAANPIVYENVTSGADIAASGNGASGHAAGVADAISAEEASSVREMIKILNLRESDASRLGIDQSQFASLWQGSTDSVDASTLSTVHSRLQNMLN